MKTSDLKDFSFRTSTGTSLTAERTVDLNRDTEHSHQLHMYLYSQEVADKTLSFNKDISSGICTFNIVWPKVSFPSNNFP